MQANIGTACRGMGGECGKVSAAEAGMPGSKTRYDLWLGGHSTIEPTERARSTVLLPSCTVGGWHLGRDAA